MTQMLLSVPFCRWGDGKVKEVILSWLYIEITGKLVTITDAWLQPQLIKSDTRVGLSMGGI